MTLALRESPPICFLLYLLFNQRNGYREVFVLTGAPHSWWNFQLNYNKKSFIMIKASFCIGFFVQNITKHFKERSHLHLHVTRLTKKKFF